MARLPPLLSLPLGALLIALVGSAVGLGVNAVRPGGIAIVAAFPYEQDCPEKLAIPAGPVIDAARARQLFGAPDVLLVDARPAEAFAAGHLPGARSLPFSFIDEVSSEAAASLGRAGKQHLIVYCDSPGDKLARLLAAQLRARGLADVKVLEDGRAALAGASRRQP